MSARNKVNKKSSWKKWAASGAVEAGTDSQINTLLLQLESDIRCDCHRTETAFNRSGTKTKLLEIGPYVLNLIAKHMKKHFPEKDTRELDVSAVDYDMFGVWVWLISNFRKKYNLPPTPYKSHVVFADQNIHDWRRYCLSAHSYAI